MKRDDLIYLAAMIDAEGCIDARHRRSNNGYNPTLALEIQIGNTDERLILWLVRKFGGRVSTLEYSNPNHRDFHTWHLPIRSNRQVAEAVMPFMKLKRRQLKLALILADTATASRGRGSRLHPSVITKRDRLVAEIARLKRDFQ